MEPNPELIAALEAAFDQYNDAGNAPAEHARLKREFIFHMTDWLSDLNALHQLYHSPETVKRAVAAETIFAFLVHALPHLSEAGRILLGEPVPNRVVADEQDHPIEPIPTRP